MLDFVVFFILPVHVMVILPVVFRPAHPGFSLSDENKGLDCSFLGNLHDDSPVDGVSIREGVSAVDGIVFNREICNRHPPATEITKGNEPGRTEAWLTLQSFSLLCLSFSMLRAGWTGWTRAFSSLFSNLRHLIKAKAPCLVISTL